MGSHAGIHEEHLPRLAHQTLGGSAKALGELYVAFAEDGFGAAHRVLVRRAVARANRLAAAREVPLDTVRAPAARPYQPLDGLALDRALATLTPALRSVFELMAVEGNSHREISAMLRIGVGASKVHLHRARKELRLLLGDGV